MISKRLPPDERHYSEPEIIPPGQGDGNEIDSTFWRDGATNEPGTRRVYVTRVGPWGLLLSMLLGGVISIALLVFLFGFLLILVPVAGLLLAAALIGSFLRGPPRWPR